VEELGLVGHGVSLLGTGIKSLVSTTKRALENGYHSFDSTVHDGSLRYSEDLVGSSEGIAVFIISLAWYTVRAFAATQIISLVVST
jgi:hypothetical protein